MRHSVWVPFLVVLAPWACAQEPVASPEAEKSTLRIVATMEQGTATEIDAARATLTGPVTQSLDLVRTDDGFEALVEQIPTGTYSVAVEGLVGGETDRFGRMTGVVVSADAPSNATVTLRSFVPTVGDFLSPSTSTTLVVTYSAVQLAVGYVVELATRPDFQTASRTATAETKTLLFSAALGTHYIRVRATNEVVQLGRASEVKSVQIVTDQTVSGDDAATAPTIGVRTAASGTYGALNILPAGDEDWFAIDVMAGDALTVGVRSTSLEPPSTLNPIVAVMDETNQLVAENDDADGTTREARLRTVVTSDGTYFLRVAGLDGASAGHYELDVLVVAGDVAIVIAEVHTSLLSSIRDRRRTVITTATEWQDFWNDFTGAIVPKPDLPVIDFTKHMVIVASMGERATGGYTIAIDEVLEEGEGLAARVVEMSPAPGCVVAPVITAPVTAVVVPRNDGTVVFVEETRTQACG